MYRGRKCCRYNNKSSSQDVTEELHYEKQLRNIWKRWNKCPDVERFYTNISCQWMFHVWATSLLQGEYGHSRYRIICYIYAMLFIIIALLLDWYYCYMSKSVFIVVFLSMKPPGIIWIHFIIHDLVNASNTQSCCDTFAFLSDMLIGAVLADVHTK